MGQQICATSGFEDTDEYKAMEEENIENIEDSVKENKNLYAFINKEITPQFTYRDLYDMILKEVDKYKDSCKINIGFGIMLKHKLTNVYNYYYVSNNHLLLNRAFTIAKRNDVKKFIKKVYDEDVGVTSYFRRPDSSWQLVGLPNVMIKIFFLDEILG